MYFIQTVRIDAYLTVQLPVARFEAYANYNKVVVMRSLAVLPLAGGRGTTFYLI